jgi:tetratricopeptide (TPR) repeat protein
VLEAAAVLGREFDTRLLAAMLPDSGTAPDDAIDDAAIAHLVEESATDEFRFVHALVRDALYDQIPPNRRRALHRAAALALSSDVNGGTRVSEIAQHWLIGARGDDAAVLRDACVAAAQHAADVLAFEDAAHWYEHALTKDRSLDDFERRAILISLAEARMASGQVALSRDAYHSAAALTSDGPRLAEIALAVHGPARVEFAHERETVLLRRALAATDDDADPATAARLHAHVAFSLTDWSPEQASEAAIAVALAERSSDPRARFDAHRARFWHFGPFDRCWEHAEAALEAARLLDTPSDLLEGLVVALLGTGQIGDFVRFRELAIEHSERAESSRLPFARAQSRMVSARMALTEGNVAEAERFAAEMLTLSDDPSLLLGFGVIQIQVATLRNQHAQSAAAQQSWLDAGLVPGTAKALVELGVGRSLARAGQLDQARNVLDAVAENDFQALAPAGDAFRCPQLAALADLISALSDADRAAQVVSLIEPWLGQHFQISLPEDCGPATLYLGMLERVRGRTREAVAHLESALDALVRSGAHWKACETRIELGKALAHERPERAARLLRDARAFADTADLPFLVRQTTETLEEI